MKIMKKVVAFKDTLPISMMRYKQEPEFDLHRHDFLEITYVLSGHGIHSVGTQQFAVEAGEVYFINYETEHCFATVDEADPLWVLNCAFTPDILNAEMLGVQNFAETISTFFYNFIFHDEIKGNPYIGIKDSDRSIRRLMLRMEEEYEKKPDGFLDYMAASLVLVLIDIMRLYTAKTKSETRSSRSFRKNSIEDVLEHIRTHIKEPMSLQELSYIAFVSPSYLCRLFKSAMGITVSEYIQEEKLRYACKMLSETDKTVSAIAYEIGYQDAKFFRKIFNRKFGITPSEYRKQSGANVANDADIDILNERK